jgi:hypothetical protein
MMKTLLALSLSLLPSMALATTKLQGDLGRLIRQAPAAKKLEFSSANIAPNPFKHAPGGRLLVIGWRSNGPRHPETPFRIRARWLPTGEGVAMSELTVKNTSH